MLSCIHNAILYQLSSRPRSGPETLQPMADHHAQPHGRLALVTGGGRGIGEAVCRRLAASGFRVVVADIDGGNARAVAQSLGAEPGFHHFRQFDVSDEAAVEAAFDDIEGSIGPVAALVCVAGILLMPGGERSLIKDTSLEDWERTFAVNARSVFLCGRAYLRRREAAPVAHGRIVTFGSVAAQLGGYRSSATYIGAKSAVLGLTKAMARESAHMGVTVNSVAPGLIDTDMLRGTVQSSGALAAAAANIPLGRIGTVDDVAGAVDYLVSEQAAYITGNVIDVNGGYRMQ
ncbi:NAD(P)-dependent dehydrogenase, short-chain alcohol dehydrogenase family [Variovorax sp. OK605]|nr:NAD(P)-dependent dehydrogenase, short-chain alcohol dehydrogenase family [Variovorax sp. OK605]